MASEWQDISTAPKDGTWVLGWRNTRAIEDSVQVYRWYDRRETDPPFWQNAADSNDLDGEQPTHWMPLPEPPDAPK